MQIIGSGYSESQKYNTRKMKIEMNKKLRKPRLEIKVELGDLKKIIFVS